MAKRRNSVVERTAELSMDQECDRVINKICDLFNMDEISRARILENKLLRLTVQLPYIAQCHNPRRIALSHLLITYTASYNELKEDFFHTVYDDDIMSRLERVTHFDGGSPLIIKKGLNLIALVMISDYEKDTHRDLVQGKYNPFSANSWDYDRMIQNLIKEISAIECPEIDSIMTIMEALNNYWDKPKNI